MANEESAPFFDTQSPKIHGVDPRTGKFHTYVTIASFTGNEGRGPNMDLELFYSPDLRDHIFGNWSLRFTNHIKYERESGGQSSTHSDTLRLANGEAWDTSKKIHSPTFKWNKSGAITLKHGTTEKLKTFKSLARVRPDSGQDTYESFSIPEKIISPSGLALTIEWETDNTSLPRLKSIKDEKRTLANVKYAGTSYTGFLITFDIYPDSAQKYTYEFKVKEHNLAPLPASKKLTETCHSNSSMTTSYEYKNNINLESIKRFPSLSEKIIYDDKKEIIYDVKEEITYDVNEKVTRHTTNANGKKVSDSAYSYRSTPEEAITTRTIMIDGKPCTTDFHYENKNIPTKGIQTKEVHSQGECKQTIQKTNIYDKNSKKLTSTTQHISEHNKATKSETSKATVDVFANLIDTTENGVTTEWTYYRGAAKEDSVVQKKTVEDVSGLAGWVGWFLDHQDVAYLSSHLSEQGFTWGTVEDHTVTQAPFKTNSGKADYQLPIEISCPGDPNYFRVHPESEKVSFTDHNGNRTDLKWTFYSYSEFPTKDPSLAGPAVKPALKLTILDPAVTADFKLKPKQNGKMTVESIEYYTDNTNSTTFDRVKNLTQYLLDEDGSEVPLSKLKTEFGYEIKDDRLTTTSTLKSADGKSVITSRTVSALTGEVIETIDSAGNKTTYEYDNSGRLISRKEFNQHADSKNITLFHYEFINGLQCITTKFPSGGSYREEHDALGRIVTTKHYNPSTKDWFTLSTTTYDELGREKQTIEFDCAPDGKNPTSRTMETSYDNWGHPSKVLINNKESFHTEFDPINRKLSKWRQSGNHSNGVRINIADTPNGGHQRDEEVFVKDITEKATPTTSNTYDAWGRLKKEKPSQGPALEYGYDNFSRLVKVANDNVTVFNTYPAHSAAETVLSTEIEGLNNYTLGQRKTDGLGRINEMSVGGRKQIYTYANSGSLGEGNLSGSNFHSTETATLESSYDRMTGRISDKTTGYPDGSSSHTHSVYSLRGLLLESQDTFDNTTLYEYDSLGRPTKSTSNQVDTLLSYFDNGSLKEQTVTHNDSKRSMTITYTYDELLRESERRFKFIGFSDLIIKRTYQGAWLASSDMFEAEKLLRSEKFTYSPDGRLLSYQCSGREMPVDPQGKKIAKQVFAYDVLGNITQCISTLDQEENTSIFTYDAIDHTQLKSVKHSLEPYPKTTATYDELGRLKEDFMGRTLSYNEASKPSYSKSGAGKGFTDYEYMYDSLGRQVGCFGTNYGEKYYYQKGRQYARSGRMIVGEETITRTLLLLNESDACILQQEKIEERKPSISNSFELMDANGSLVASYDLATNRPTYFAYTPFGYRPDDWSKPNWLGFNGQPIDRVTNTYHLGNGYRVYDPANQHFQAPDSLSPFGAGGLNGYSYCSNNPINFSDPSGHAQVVRQYSVMTHQPFLHNPVMRAAMMGGIGIALAPFTGGASIGWTTAAIGLAVTSAAFGIASAALEESDPELSSALGWASLGTGLASAGAGLVGAKLAARGAMFAATAERAGVSSAGRAGVTTGRPVAMAGDMRFFKEIDSGLYTFTDVHKGGLRLNINAHGNELATAVANRHNIIFNGMEHSPSELLSALKGMHVDPSKYDHVRLLMCYSANGGATSFAAEFQQLIQRPLKAFVGPVYMDYGATTMQYNFAKPFPKLETSKLFSNLKLNVSKVNPFDVIHEPTDYLKFRYSPHYFGPR
jgi:RHS repeat-associated protein